MPVVYASKDSLTDLARLQFSKFFNVAALAIFVFDYFLTFSSEVEYVWGTKWDAMRVVFTISRYLPFVAASLTCYDALANRGCGGFLIALDAMYIAGIIFAEVILIVRTYALWGRSGRVLVFLLISAADLAIDFVFEACIAAAEGMSLTIKIVQPWDATSSYQFLPSFCAFRSSRSTTLQYACLVAFEILLQSMNSWRKFRTYRDSDNRTLNTLYWDGIMYMWCVILLSGGNMTVMAVAPIAYIPVLDTAQVALHGLLACRIFFNLRQCDRQVNSFGDTSEFTLETLRYRAQSTGDTTTQPTTEEVISIA